MRPLMEGLLLFFFLAHEELFCVIGSLPLILNVTTFKKLNEVKSTVSVYYCISFGKKEKTGIELKVSTLMLPSWSVLCVWCVCVCRTCVRVCVCVVLACVVCVCVCARALPFEKEGQKKLTSVCVLPFEEEGRKKLMTNDRR